MSEHKAKSEKFLKKAEREACWNAKDKFWSCMQASNENESLCVESRTLFNELCPPTWVTHFDRKFQYEKFKANLAKSGIEEVDKKYTSNEKKEEK